MKEQRYFYDLDSSEIKYLCSKDKRLAKAIEMVGPLEYNLHLDAYVFLVNTIIGQMLSNKVAYVLKDRLEKLCNNNITPVIIQDLGYNKIHDLGLSKQKATYIMTLTSKIINHEFNFDAIANLQDETAIKEITSLPGIGNWSAKMYLIFVLNRMDVLPFEDGAFLQSYKWLYKTDDTSPEAIKKKCKKWSPYSSLAARYLYRVLDYGLTKEPFHLYK